MLWHRFDACRLRKKSLGALVGVKNMRVFLVALGICVSSAAVSAAFFLTVFDHKADYNVAKKPPIVEEPAVASDPELVAKEPEPAPEIDLAALSHKGLSPDEMAWRRARGSYRVPVPKQNPFDQIVDISELVAVSGADLDEQTAAVGFGPSVELAKEQLDDLGDDSVLRSSAAIAPTTLEETTIDPASLGILGVILEAAQNGGQTVNNNSDIGPATPSVQIGP